MTPEPITVTLTRAQLELAEAVGTRRNENAARLNCQPKAAQRADQTLEAHRNGAAGELAFAIVIGREDEWPGPNGGLDGPQDKSKGDVAGCEVRTREKHWHDLHFRPGDLDIPHVLVTGVRPHLSVRGWIHGRDCRKPGYLADHGNRGAPAYFVPVTALSPIDDRRSRWRCGCGRTMPPDYPFARCLRCELQAPALDRRILGEAR